MIKVFADYHENHKLFDEQVSFSIEADEANTVLSDGTYKIATKGNTFDALVTRDSVGDIFGTSFRGEF